MKILILGAKGNLGCELMGVYSDLHPTGWDVEDLDITDEQDVFDKITKFAPDVVYNCAAYNAVDKAEEDRITAEQVNGYAVGNIAKACAAAKSILVHYSSGQVFDGKNPEGYNEADPANPVNAYGKSKFIGEMEAQEHHDKVYIFRTSWLFGKMGPGQSNKKSFIELILEKAKTGEEIKMVEDEIGKPTYTLDLAQASRAVLEETKPFGIYHLVNSGAVSRLDWAQEIFKMKKMDVNIIPVKGNSLARPAKRPHYEILNNTKFLEMRPWIEALAEFLES